MRVRTKKVDEQLIGWIKMNQELSDARLADFFKISVRTLERIRSSGYNFFGYCELMDRKYALEKVSKRLRKGNVKRRGNGTLWSILFTVIAFCWLFVLLITR
jgi:hypothetical protein